MIKIVKGAVVDSGKVLVVQRSADRKYGALRYTFPGGHVEDGECLEDAVKREIFEEVGLEVSVGDVFRKRKVPTVEKDDFLDVTEFVCFGSGDVKLNSELCGFWWVYDDFSGFPDRIKYDVELVRKYLLKSTPNTKPKYLIFSEQT